MNQLAAYTFITGLALGFALTAFTGVFEGIADWVTRWLDKRFPII